MIALKIECSENVTGNGWDGTLKDIIIIVVKTKYI
jgi:hypothetical protein